MPKLIGAGRAYQSLVANLREGSDPSKGRNPVALRHEFRQQQITEIPRAGDAIDKDADPERGPGTTNYVGLITGSPPVAATGQITVLSTDFTLAATVIVGSYQLVSGADFNVTSGTPHLGEDITNTAPNGILTLFDTAGPNFINVPANLPIAPGSVTIRWVSGGNPYSQVDDGAGNFTGDGTPAPGGIDYVLGAITLNTAPLAPDGGSLITIDYSEVVSVTNIAASLAAAINALPGFDAVAVGPVITVTDGHGPQGNKLPFEVEYSGAVVNFALVPATGLFGGGVPIIGPPAIT